jgi:hypothetical protein
MNTVWTPTPFPVWLYAKMCARNETSVHTLVDDLTYFTVVRELMPRPRNFLQRQVRKYVDWMLRNKIAEILSLMDMGMVGAGYIMFKVPEAQCSE